MPRKDRFDRAYASDAQIRAAEIEKRDLEKMLKADRASGRNMIQDVGRFNEEIKKNQEIIDSAPRKLKGNAANKAYKEAKELREEIQKAMPSGRAYYQMYPDGKGHKKERDFETTVQQQIEFQTNKKLKRAQTRFKAIMASLDPDDPRVRNIENLRK